MNRNKLEPPYTIQLEYSGIKVTIEAETLEAIIDAYLIGSAVLKETNDLGHGQPKLFLTALQRKEEKTTKKGKDS